MRVAFASTYPPVRCGIGDYTAELRKAAAKVAPAVDVIVLAEVGGEGAASDGPGVFRVWDRKTDWVADLTRAASEHKPDVVHLQHEEGILGQDERLPRLLENLAKLGIRSVVTLHSVYTFPWPVPGRLSPAQFHRGIADHASRIIVHQKTGMQDVLCHQGVPAEKIAVIPHGTPEVPHLDQVDSRTRLGLPQGVPLALFFGFIHWQKGVPTVVRAFKDVVRALPKARLVVAGHLRDRHVIDHTFKRYLALTMRPGLKAGWLDYRKGFANAADIPAYLAAADVIVLPHQQKYGSASGVMHAVLGAGRPLLCARGLKFSEAIESIEAEGNLSADLDHVLPESGNVKSWAKSLTRVLGDADLRERMAALSVRLGRETAWPLVANKHVDVYAAALGQSASAAVASAPATSSPTPVMPPLPPKLPTHTHRGAA